MKQTWIYCIDVAEALNKCCCSGCHHEEETGYDPMMDFQPPNNSHGHSSNIRGYGCCIFNDLSRDDWAKIIKHKRNQR